MKEVTIPLTILAEDIRRNNYVNADECPITRALIRAGYPELKEAGGDILRYGESVCQSHSSKFKNYCPNYAELENRLFGMYNTFHKEKGHSEHCYKEHPHIPLEDFTITITVIL